MTIEEKAKAYDNIIEKANKMHSENCEACQMCIEELIPELAESEDERIRKAIHIYLDWLDGKKDVAPKGEYSIRDMLAWLEKRGKENPLKNTLGDVLDDLKFGLDPSPKQDEQNPTVVPKFRIGDTIKNKKTNEIFTISDYSQLYKYYHDINHSHEIKFSEQDDWELVEPKFAVGDIITNGMVIGKVDKNENNKYHGWFGYNKDLSVHYSDIPDIENWHKWTIADAKDGDVLKEDSCIFVVEKMNPNGTAVVYCCLFDDGDFDLIGSSLSFDVDSTYPATKEQRDLLFQKIKEAGYKWDADKKELRKIEQKPVESVHFDFSGEIPVPTDPFRFNLESCIYNFGKSIAAECLGTHILDKELDEYVSDKKVREFLSQYIDNLTKYHPLQKPVECKLDSKIQGVISEHNIIFEQIVERYRNSNPFKTLIANLQNWWDNTRRHLNVINKQRPWSEEDEKIYQSIMDDTVQENQLDGKQIDWLRDIKYRYFPQPKQEWSEEDENGFGDTLWAIERARSTAKDDNDMGNLWYAEGWVKSLKNRYAWKPSDEQMKILNEVLNFAANHESSHWNDYIFGTLNNLRRQLKKLSDE